MRKPGPRRDSDDLAVDRQVGGRIKRRRIMMGLSQTGLAHHLDITFQQVQKYEKGANRVSASMLVKAARALEVPVTYFFENLGGIGARYEPLHRLDLETMKNFQRLDESMQREIHHFIKRLAGRQ